MSVSIEGYEQYLEKAQLLISIATALYFLICYHKEGERIQVNGYTLKYIFFVVLFSNACAVAYERTMFLIGETSGPDYRLWLIVFSFIFLISIFIPRTARK